MTTADSYSEKESLHFLRKERLRDRKTKNFSVQRGPRLSPQLDQKESGWGLILGTIFNNATVGKIPTRQKSNQFLMQLKMYFMSLK